MAFYENEFPRQLELNVTGGPEFFTTKNSGFSGWAQWNQNWAFPLGEWSVNATSQQSSDGRIPDYDVLLAFFMNMKGMANGFRLFAPGYNTGKGEFIANGDGLATEFQLQKTFSIYGSSYSVPIKKPITATIRDYQGNLLSARSDFQDVVAYVDLTPTTVTVDATTGLITFSSPPAGGTTITADFQYHVPVHFKSDKWNVQVRESYVRGGQGIFRASLEIEQIRV